MSAYFHNKVVVVTGGTDGIGKALVNALLEMGAKVATCGRNHDKLYQLQSEHPSAALHTMVADVTSENDCRRFIETTIKFFGGVDILINNAGISMRALMKETSMDTMRKVMDINFFGAVYCTRYALDSIIERKGTIVGVSSIAGYRGLPGRSGYEILTQIRRNGSQIAVLLLTARDSIEDRVNGLDSGADDYLVKPFAFPELLARCRALLRRGLV